MIKPTEDREFPLREAHNLVRDLMTPNPWIYWTDFLFHISLGWAAFVIFLSMPLSLPWQFLAGIVATFAFYRAAIFIHELAHLKKGTFRFFASSGTSLAGYRYSFPPLLTMACTTTITSAMCMARTRTASMCPSQP